MTDFVQNIVNEIIDQYMFADNTKRPWIIGFSGGKDSTVMLQLVWAALEQVKHFHGFVGRDVYVVCNDTMVENPVITEYVYRVLDKIGIAARDQDLPIRVVKTLPRLEDSLWVNMIGRGYPAPNNAFRWCTERLKIKPTSRFITEQVNEFGEAIILIGTRMSESANRAKSMNKHAIRGKRLTKHPLQPNTYMYAPIRHLQLEQVWYIINTMKSPWGASNEELFQIYANASADDYECPVVVTDTKHKSCGQSRFGCWMCTVVKEDKSMGALINNGFAWLKPLIKFRDEIVAERNDIKNRMPLRRNGTQAVNDMGSYYPCYRASILERLLRTQKEIQKDKQYIELITNQELIAIQTIWYRDFVFEYKVSEIYHNAYKSNLDMDEHNKKKDNELNTLVNYLKHTFRDNFTRLNDNYLRSKSDLDSIRRKIRSAEKDAEDEYIANSRAAKKRLDDQIFSIDKDIYGLHEKIGGLKTEIKTLKQRQEELRKKIDDSRRYSEKDRKTQELVTQLKDFIKEFKITTKKKLEENILNELNILMHKKGFIHKVVVDINQAGDDVDINLFDVRNEKIDKGSLSMGERQMYASSLLKSLVDESDIEFPVFIDSPMQKFDKDHAENVIKEFYPNVSKQVILFPLIHKELTESEFELLKPNICKAYIIDNFNTDASKFVETNPEDLIDKYDELYAN